MKEQDVHKCLLSWGLFPMTLVLKELEAREQYEECGSILKAIKSFKEKFSIIPKEAPTAWSQSLEDEYYGLFKKEPDLIRDNMDYYVKDIKKRLFSLGNDYICKK